MVDGADLMDSRTSSHFRGLGFDCPEIEFSCSQIRQCFQSKKLTAPGLPQWREIALRQLLQNGRKLLLGKGVQDNDSLSLFFIRDGRKKGRENHCPAHPSRGEACAHFGEAGAERSPAIVEAPEQSIFSTGNTAVSGNRKTRSPGSQSQGHGNDCWCGCPLSPLRPPSSNPIVADRSLSGVFLESPTRGFPVAEWWPDVPTTRYPHLLTAEGPAQWVAARLRRPDDQVA